jgi:hypothetical protein
VSANNTVGSYTVSASAAGGSGNADFLLTNLTTVASIVRVTDSPTNASNIDFTVTFDHAISGVQASNFSLTSTGSVTGTIASVSGSGTTWTVTVDGISGDGTMGLDMVNDALVLPGVGNLPYTTGEAYTIDNTLPTVSITTAPSNPSGSTEASISFTATDSDGIASLECQLDGGAFEPCSSPVSYTGLGDGKHTVTVQATDNVGNTGSASHTWTIDTTLPTVSITAAPDDPSGSTEASISFTASDSDGIASLECQLDGGAWEPCSSPVSYTGLSDGEHTVTVRATDNVGNTGSASHTWTIDSTLPVVSITAAPDDPSGSTEASISFTATDSDGIASLECQLDGGAWEP